MSAAGFSSWIQLDRLQYDFKVALAVMPSSGAVLTYTVQHTFDDIHDTTQLFSIARVTTTATVTKIGHGLSVGDWISVYNAGTPFDGEYSVASVTSADVFTYTVANTGAASLSLGYGNINTARVFPHSALASLTARADGNYAFPCFATRLLVSAYTSGTVDLTVIEGHR
jgi:hypothetical protein